MLIISLPEKDQLYSLTVDFNFNKLGQFDLNLHQSLFPLIYTFYIFLNKLIQEMKKNYL